MRGEQPGEGAHRRAEAGRVPGVTGEDADGGGPGGRAVPGVLGHRVQGGDRVGQGVGAAEGEPGAGGAVAALPSEGLRSRTAS